MDAYRFVDHETLDLADALVLLGFPTVGFVGTIAAAYLVEAFDMRHVASVVSPRLPPVAIVRDAQALAPVRVYAGEVVCGVDGECNRLVIVASDAVPPPEDVVPFLEALLDWIAERQGKRVVCLEGLHSSDAPSASPKVYGVGSVPAVATTLEYLGIEPLREGNLTGVSGVVLYLARPRGIGALTLVAETVPDYPDARAAARLVELLNPILPQLELDPKPLYARAEALETHFRSRFRRQQEDLTRIAEQSRMMYG